MNDEQEKVQARIHSLGQQIRAHRIAQNLSQQRLALMVHTDQAVIARIEAGKHNTGIAKYIENPPLQNVGSASAAARVAL